LVCDSSRSKFSDFQQATLRKNHIPIDGISVIVFTKQK